MILSLLIVTGLASCNNYGKKINPEGTKGEVLYKEGVSEKEANKVAEFLKQEGYLNDKRAATVQVAKENGEYTVRFVLQFPVLEEYRTDAATIAEIEKIAKQIKENVFAGDPCSFQMVDEKLKAIKSFDY